MIPSGPAAIPRGTREGDRPGRHRASPLVAVILLLGTAGTARAQLPISQHGEVIPRDVREMYDRGLQFLASTQSERGDWSGQAFENGPGIIGLALMAFLASGEDPNF